MDGIYIHVPFCSGKCPYCDFYSVFANEETIRSYVDSVLLAIEKSPYALKADTVYFGGGTPSLLKEKYLTEILLAVIKKFNVDSSSEITLEANPCSVNYEMLSSLKQSGFNRISFGIQSTDDNILKILGRKHNYQQAESAVKLADKAGFSHISSDLMLCVPSQTNNNLLQDITKLSSLPIDHISAYMLKLEPNTPFYNMYCEPDEDFSADAYLMAAELLEAKGFHQYEISNFSKSVDSQSKHNLKYWLLSDYLGIGPSAHSLVEGKRFYFERDLNKFIKSSNPWENTVFESYGNTEQEKIMLNLRLTTGLNLKSLNYNTKNLYTVCESFCKAGLGSIVDDTFALNPKGFLISNYIITKCLENYRSDL